MARDTTAPPKKKAKKDTIASGGIVADWESHRKPIIPSATASSADFSNADDHSMVKNGGILSDDEHDDVEREALAKEPTKFQKGGKAKIVRYCFINYS